MQSSDLEMEDELRPEYDLKSMRARKLGAGRCGFTRMDGQKEDSRAKYEATLARVLDIKTEVYNR